MEVCTRNEICSKRETPKNPKMIQNCGNGLRWRKNHRHQRDHIQATAGLHTWLTSCQICISNRGCSRGAMAPCRHIPTQKPYESAWGSDDVARDQPGSPRAHRTRTCLVFYHKGPMIKKLTGCCVAFFGSCVWEKRGLSRELKQTDV